MKERRFYTPSLPSPGQLVELSASEARHALKVLRLRVGAKVTLFDGRGTVGEGRIHRLEENRVFVLLDKLSREAEEPPTQAFTLALAVSKEEAFSTALRGACELGVNTIQPLLCERSRPLPREKWSKCESRWCRILENSTKQCGRTFLPRLAPIQLLSEFLATLPPQGTLLWGSPRGPQWTDLSWESLSPPLWLCIGPEGGFSPQEEELLSAQGQPFSFGAFTLRMETAAIALTTLVLSQWKKSFSFS